MTTDWRTTGRSRGFRTAGVTVAAALFLWAVGGFLFALVRPFEAPRLFVLVCDDDPATAGAAPLRQLAEASPRGVVLREVTEAPGAPWLEAVAELAREVRPRDRVLICARGRWIDRPTPSIAGHRSAGSKTRDGPLEVDALVEAVAALPSSTVVLCLDDSDPTLDQFAERLAESEHVAASERVVVVTSHGFGEESFPLPGRRCTTFLDSLAAALGERADRNHDGGLSVREFVKSVTRDVDGWAAELTAGRESQTVRVLGPATALGGGALCPVLPRPPSDGEQPEPSADQPELDSLLDACWTLADSVVDRCVAVETPLVACRELLGELLELERRSRFGERSTELRDSLTAVRQTLEALENGQPLRGSVPTWATVVESSLTVTETDPTENDSVRRSFLAGLREKLDDPKSVVEWIDSTAAPKSSRLPALARAIASRSAVDSAVLRDVLRTRVAIELFALDRTSTVGDRALEEAERRQLRAERLIVDAVEADWLGRSRRATAEAREWLQRARSSVALHVASHTQSRRTTLVFPDLLDVDQRLQFWENDPAEVGTVLDDALGALTSLRVRLRDPARWDDRSVEHALRSLESSRRRLLQPVGRVVGRSSPAEQSPPSAVEIARLSRTGLPRAEDRTALRAAWARWSERLPAHAPRPTSAGKIIVRGLASGLARNFRRRAEFDATFDVASTSSTSERDELSRLVEEMATHGEGRPLLNSVREFHLLQDTRRLHRPTALRSATNTLLSGSLDPTTLASATELWNAYDGLASSNDLPTTETKLRQFVQRGRRTHRIDGDARRTLLAAQDASSRELPLVEARFHEVLSGRPRVEGWTSPGWPRLAVVRIPTRETLGDGEDTRIEVVVRGEPESLRDARFTVQYDVDEFAVRLADGTTLLPSSDPPRPYSTERASSGVPVPDSGRLLLGVRARSQGEHGGNLLVRVRSRTGTSRGECRLERVPRLPFQLELSAAGGAVEDKWGWTITPFTGQPVQLRWTVRNDTDAPTAAGVRLVAVPRIPDDLPRSVVPAEVADSVLRLVDGRIELANVGGIAVPASPDGVPVPFPKAELETPLDVTGGLIAVLEDIKVGTARLMPIRFRPRRPSGYVEIDCRTERTTGRIGVLARVRLPRQLADGGVPVAVRLAGGTPAGSARTQGVLTKTGPSAELSLFSPPGEPATVYVDVAGWPRAFVFDVADGRVEPVREPRIRVVSPMAGDVYSVPETIAARVEVDLPESGFATPQDGFAIGLDTSGDRRLDDESVVRRRRERDVRLWWSGTSPDGTSSVRVNVDDFELDVPTRGLRDARRNLLARVTTGRSVVRAKPVPLVLDTTAPRLVDCKIRPGPVVVVGEPVVVLATADDGGLSGVNGVEAAFDPTREGRFTKATTPVEAVPTGTDGAWRAEVPTKGLVPGRYLLLVRAVDAAGNASDPKTVWIEAITSERAAQRAAARTTGISGVVNYGTNPAPGMKVEAKPAPHPAKSKDEGAAEPMKSLSPDDSGPTLPTVSAVTEADGSFRLTGLRSGRYVLTVEGTLRGRRFERAEPLSVDVDSPPGPIAIRLDRPSQSKEPSEQSK